MKVGDYMAESLNMMVKHHMEKSSLEDLMGKQICPTNIDLQVKQVYEVARWVMPEGMTY